MNLNSLLTESQTTGLLCIAFSDLGKEAGIKQRFKSPVFAHWSELSISDGDFKVDGKSVSQFTKVLIGAVGDHSAINSALRAYLEKRKIPVFSYGSPEEENNKLLQSVLLENNKLKQIRTVIAAGKSVTADQLVEQLKLPIVSKITNGSQGKGVKKHEHAESIKKLLSQDPEKFFIFQEFIPNDGDYRVFFIRNQHVYTISRKSSKKSEFRNNVSLGAEWEYVDLPSDAQRLAAGAVRAMKFDVTGVDLIQHSETKEWYVIEVNSAPQFTGDEFQKVIGKISDIVENL